MSDSAALSGSAGSVLDPVVAIRYRITLEPEQSATVDFVTGTADTSRWKVAHSAPHLINNYITSAVERG